MLSCSGEAHYRSRKTCQRKTTETRWSDPVKRVASGIMQKAVSTAFTEKLTNQVARWRHLVKSHCKVTLCKINSRSLILLLNMSRLELFTWWTDGKLYWCQGWMLQPVWHPWPWTICLQVEHCLRHRHGTCTSDHRSIWRSLDLVLAQLYYKDWIKIMFHMNL